MLGIAAIVAIAWAVSENRKVFDWRGVVAGLALQFGLAFLLLRLPGARDVFLALNGLVLALQDATRQGTAFVFGYLGGGPAPFEATQPGNSFVLALQALPLILVISALSALLWHWRILPVVVKAVSAVLERIFAIGGAVGVSAAANIFVGMVEAPLLVRPYFARLTRAEIFMVMTCGMATVAGTVMVLYASFLSQVIPGALGHILTASIISVPAALMVARLMVPGVEKTESDGSIPELEYDSSMDAITRGTEQGVQLLINVTAMLIVLIALVALVNALLGLLPPVFGAELSLQRVFGWIFAPYAWLIGIPAHEAATAGELLGLKTVLNEFIAYLQLAKLPADTLDERSRLILVYALCGFANPGSLGIMIGGLVAMAPQRRGELVQLAGKSVLSGTLATGLTGAVVGILW
ncbi:concentrative nucleoside transporter, CNT family [Tistlia consotensis]|uniref:Concentrative nucleoside transporter, CNT family n=1 Tax=Tistlia consotensis USBA 355 TaxID=560819 RepID=A0A1Y6CPF3_9PROT|nr:nucleoside transporter C-terminal domain-containing protein [Tistlia consotensis]SMF80854.1 concentrative nucleoside transporter, CNT family [Tistlia consotensis USBA 355]SNS21897.1 concentrative nucleoside transporter, CNT family [Tistlia consotensis]